MFSDLGNGWGFDACLVVVIDAVSERLSVCSDMVLLISYQKDASAFELRLVSQILVLILPHRMLLPASCILLSCNS